MFSLPPLMLSHIINAFIPLLSHWKSCAESQSEEEADALILLGPNLEVGGNLTSIKKSQMSHWRTSAFFHPV